MKKAFLVALILAVCVSPSVFAQQSRADKLEEIERQIANYVLVQREMEFSALEISE